VEEFYSQKIETNASGPKYSIVRGYLPIGFTVSSTGDISGTAISYAEPSVFTVEVTNDLGCSVQKEYTMKSELLVSKMFSPNGDGLNDIFMKGYKVVMFDRLGRKLYNGDNGWDGTFNNRIVPEDVYYYILYYKDKDGKEKHVTGYVTLIKTI
jgi:gliding motility-associated-like protein